jgi:probable phosphomutase (TIGR03848 family)
MTQILLIRHARNDWVGKRLPGWTPGIHLSAEGRAEAAALAERLASTPLDAVYSSTLDRALETAAYIAGPRSLPVIEVADLVDVDTGDWTGRDLKEVSKEPSWWGVVFRPSLTRLPGGETLWEMQVRAVTALERIRAAHPDGAVAVVAHADVIKALVAHYLGLPLDLFQRIGVSTASVSVLHVGDNGAALAALNLTGSIPTPPAPDEEEGDTAASPEHPGHEGAR